MIPAIQFCARLLAGLELVTSATLGNQVVAVVAEKIDRTAGLHPFQYAIALGAMGFNLEPLATMLTLAR